MASLVIGIVGMLQLRLARLHRRDHPLHHERGEREAVPHPGPRTSRRSSERRIPANSKARLPAGLRYLRSGALGQTRTGTDRSTRPSNVRVYQFRHQGTVVREGDGIPIRGEESSLEADRVVTTSAPAARGVCRGRRGRCTGRGAGATARCWPGPSCRHCRRGLGRRLIAECLEDRRLRAGLQQRDRDGQDGERDEGPGRHLLEDGRRAARAEGRLRGGGAEGARRRGAFPLLEEDHQDEEDADEDVDGDEDEIMRESGPPPGGETGR